MNRSLIIVDDILASQSNCRGTLQLSSVRGGDVTLLQIGNFRNADNSSNRNSCVDGGDILEIIQDNYSTGIKELVIRREAISLQLQGYEI